MRVRPFHSGDLVSAARLSADLRREDPSAEPFGEALARLWRSARARPALWHVGEANPGRLEGVTFVLERQPGELDVYGAVRPSARRRGLGSRLLSPALDAAVRDRLALHAQVRDGGAGLAFLARHGFVAVGRTLLLERKGGPPRAPGIVARALDPSRPDERALLLLLSSSAYAGLPEGFPLTEGDLGRFAPPDGLALIAEEAGEAVAYLTARVHPGALAIEEVGVVPGARRRGLGTALVAEALRRRSAHAAVLAVDEANEPARGFYRRLQFAEVSARTRLYRR